MIYWVGYFAFGGLFVFATIWYFIVALRGHRPMNQQPSR
jgi:hypothetical protein